MPRTFESRLIVFISLAAMLWTPAAWAQRGQDAELIGTIRDASGAVLADATVTVSSPQLIGKERSATTDTLGAYRLPFLPAGEYEVTASRSGFGSTTRAALPLRPGLTLTVDLTLNVAGVSETVSVIGASSTVDVRASSAPVLIDRGLVENLPLPRIPASGAGTVADTVNLAPGVVQSVSLGGTFLANALSIDGSSGTEPGYGQPIVNPSISWVDQIQIISVGADAQYGGYTGAIVNAITRSGSNRFSGQGEFWTTRPSWTSDNRDSLSPALQNTFRPVQISERWDAEGQIGGPVAQDRLWFFAGIESYRDAYWPVTFASGQRSSSDPQRDESDRKVIAKLTSALSPALRAEGFISHGANDITGVNAGPLVAPEALSVLNSPETIWNIRLLWTLGARAVLEVTTGGHDFTQNDGPVNGQVSGPPAHLDQLSGVFSGNAPGVSTFHDRPITTGAHLTLFQSGVTGTHALKAGFEYEHASLQAFSGYVGNEFFYDVGGQPSEVELWGGATYRPSQTRRTMFAQDSWSPTSRLTMNIGARVESYDGSVPGHSDAFSNHSFAPRIGAAYDLTADHRTVVRFHYGRYAEPLVTSYYDFLDPLSQTPDTMAAVVAPNQFVQEYQYPTAAKASIDPHVRFPYAQEFTAGVDRELPGGFSARAQYISRDFRDAIGFIDPARTWLPVQNIDPGPDGKRGTADDGGPVTVYFDQSSGASAPLLTNPDAYRRYHGVQFIGSKRQSRNLQVQASYTWSRLVGNYNNAAYSNAANNDLGVNGAFTNPNRAINTDGRTPQDFTHDFKILGSYRLVRLGGVDVSGVYRFESGRPWARAAGGFGAATGVNSILVEPRGTRELDAVRTLDLRVQKIWKPTSRPASFGVFVDAFNATNQGVALRVSNLSGPNLGVPTQWLDPRTIRAGLRIFVR
jgi:hypothetical protein